MLWTKLLEDDPLLLYADSQVLNLYQHANMMVVRVDGDWGPGQLHTKAVHYL